MASNTGPAAAVVTDKAQRTLITPEGVDLRLRIADAGQRASAFLIDILIIVGALILLTILAGFAAASAQGVVPGSQPSLGADVATIIWLVGSFLLRNAYFTVFELSPRAATPGKRALGLRVAARDGGRLRAEAVFARNAMRELEVFMPLTVLGLAVSHGDVGGWTLLLGIAWCSVFLFFPLFNRDRLRAGDLVGGTWVVRTPKQGLARDLADVASEKKERHAFTTAQLDAYGIKELHVLEDVLRLRDRKTMRAVADRIANKIGWAIDPNESDYDFLSAYYAGLRGRLEARLLMGRRRRDKHDV